MFAQAQTVRASVAGAAPVLFAATASDPSNLLIDKVSGDAQGAVVSRPVAQPLVVRVHLADGRGVTGVPVQWQADSAGFGQAAPASAATDSTGGASTAWTAGAYIGAQRMRARVAGGPSAVFTAQVAPAPVISRTVIIYDPPADAVRDSVLTLLVDVSGGPGVTSVSAQVEGRTSALAFSVTDGSWHGTVHLSGLTPGAKVLTVTSTAGDGGTASSTRDFTYAIAGQPATMVGTGSGQAAAAGALLATPLKAVVKDGFGNWIPNVTVRWRVLSGGGTITDSSVTNFQGVASAAWKLGTAPAPDSAEASLSNGLKVVYTANRAAGPTYSIAFEDPGYDFEVSESVSVLIHAFGAGIDSVVVRSDSSSVKLTFDGQYYWMGVLSTVRLPHGYATLTATAYGAAGPSSATPRRIVVNHKPVLSVTAPADSTVTSSVTYTASCADDAPGCTLQLDVLYGTSSVTPVASGASSPLSGTLSLAPYSGKTVTLRFRAVDADGALATVSRVYVVP